MGESYKAISQVILIVPSSSSSTRIQRSTPQPSLNNGPSSTQDSHSIISSPIGVSPPPPNQKETEQPRSRRYTSLLLGCVLGYPLWLPAPRKPREKRDYTIDLGDVGVFPDGLPFDSLFNVFKGLNKDKQPFDIDQERRVVEDYHGKDAIFVRPKDLADRLPEKVQGLNGSSVFRLPLTQHHGALLLLPQGSRLEFLRKLSMAPYVRSRVGAWIDWAKEQEYLEEHQTLYLVTGIGECPSWVIAAWDSTASDNTGSQRSQPSQFLSLRIAADGKCIDWHGPPARYEVRSEGSESLAGQKETVFARGFWIDHSGMISRHDSPPVSQGDSSGNGGDENHGGDGSSHNPHAPTGSSNNGSAPPPPPPPATDGGYSGSSDPYHNSTGLQDGIPVYTLDLDSSAKCFEGVEHPCQIINRFAFQLISKVYPSSLEAEYIAFSHDEDWMAIIQDSDHEQPTKMEIIRRICGEFKFIIVQGKFTHMLRVKA
ncbi:hypothetical protein V5O48_011069 [Marasmius crinis-equi]|uniref:Uncharacterized protein n=1 Tax=Marasmius crinis-equi TaxID=585013 RepID=A0ABR3F6L3_9AGAR